MKLEKVIAVRTDKTIYQDGDSVVKVFNSDFSTANVLNEALNQARVEETGLAMPKLREVSKVDGKWAIVSDFIPGKTLEQLMKEHPEKMDEYMELFVDIQISIHEKRAPLLNKLKDKMQRKISETELDATTRYELHTRLEGMPKHNKVCHGDFNPSNIIITEEGTPYVIDWAHATQGNAAADAARTYLLFSLAGESERANQYLKLFCLKTNTARQYVQKWIPIVAASQLVKKNPEEKDFLMNWVDVVEYE
ncbi:MAG: DUF1679 domain-containing protein [Ruminococcaceae bacterium]|nr:DUF1679 domain-containing protein [Oscillospiraceae bacterium]